MVYKGQGCIKKSLRRVPIQSGFLNLIKIDYVVRQKQRLQV